MRRSGRVPWGEVRVGAIILFAFAVFLWAAFNGTGMTVFESTRELEAYFDDVNGLVSGSPVWLGGIEVGLVSRIDFVEHGGVGKVHVTFEVKEDAWSLVSSASKVAIGTMGLMGDKYLSVSVRSPGQPGADIGDVLEIQRAGDLTTAFTGVPDLTDNLSEAIDHLSVVLQRIERGEGYLGRLTTNSESSADLDSLVGSTRHLMTDLNGAQKRLVNAVEKTAASFDSLSDGVLHGGGTLSRLVWDSTLYVQFDNVARRANSMVTRMDSDSGTIGKLATDSSLYVDMRGLVTELRDLVSDIKENPKKYFKVSVF